MLPDLTASLQLIVVEHSSVNLLILTPFLFDTHKKRHFEDYPFNTFSKITLIAFFCLILSSTCFIIIINFIYINVILKIIKLVF